MLILLNFTEGNFCGPGFGNNPGKISFSNMKFSVLLYFLFDLGIVGTRQQTQTSPH
jgi:hypothetical protein